MMNCCANGDGGLDRRITAEESYAKNDVLNIFTHVHNQTAGVKYCTFFLFC